ncbi:CCR4-NOT transcription complex subunit 2-like isoform X10 [Phyllopteryx taeniolatus]|uniref:CCR4-NOT transcription complex subunit 2-like isoform X10 n=1 Tax=Phyllopteryx taeniolatus TaxID=161469 RepID=UPI002AD42FBD|nr:CCR4-NOT transcription complex subunit 2-like isoform X10 [Phyllopteryx taeniolatus]
MFGANRKKFTEAGPEGDDSCGGLYYGQQSAFAAHRADKDMLASSAASSSGQLSQLGASLYGPQSALGFPVRGINSSAAPLSRSALGQSAAGQLSAHTGAAVVHTPPSPSRGILPVSSRGVLAHNQQAGGPAGQPIGMGGERGGGAGGRSAGGSSPSVIGMPKQSRQAFTINSMAGFGVNRNPGFNIFNGTDGSENVTALDLSDFPALADRARRDGGADPVPPLDPLAGRAPYVGMVTKPSSEQSRDFSIHNEDFPALPGPNYHAKDPGGDDGKTVTGTSVYTKTPHSCVTSCQLTLVSTNQNLGSSGKPASNSDGPRFPGDKCSASASGNDQHKKGIQVLPDGRVTNIPVGMVTDQFGMIGLLTFIRAAETDPGTVHLALGSDLTALGLNLNSPENLYPKFASPWASAPCRPQDIDFHVPSEYLTNIHIRDKLAAIKLSRYGEDLLFYLYYMNGGDLLQPLAAVELFNRDWRYHKEERVWITRAPGMEPSLKTNAYERGTYYFFDCLNWRKVAKEFHLEYDKLEERAHVPATFNYNPAQQAF